MTLFSKIKTIVPKSDVNKIYLLLIGIVISSILEAIGVGIILPFISVMNKPELFQNYPMILNIFLKINITDNEDMIIISAFMLLSILLSKNIYLFYFIILIFFIILNLNTPNMIKNYHE